jgi:DNA adenine methylase
VSSPRRRAPCAFDGFVAPPAYGVRVHVSAAGSPAEPVSALSTQNILDSPEELIVTRSGPIRVRPFLRWAGGKQRIVKSLLELCPKVEAYENYIEPFIGAGSLFFAIEPKRAILGDINAELINCYRQVRRHPLNLIERLDTHRNRHTEQYFYSVRREMPVDLSRLEQAARFIYLNKAAFNGIYRVNQNGQFNVPFGPSHRGIALPSAESLLAARPLLRRARLVTGDFDSTLSLAREGDFVYLDPPYPPRSETAFFAHYAQSRFPWDEQVRLAKTFRLLSNCGCLVMLSNADQKAIRDLYRGFTIRRLKVIRWLGSNGDRFGVREIVVTNYVR